MGEATGAEMQVGLPPSVLSPHRPLIRADPAPSLPALSLPPTKPSAPKSTRAGSLGPGVCPPRQGEAAGSLGLPGVGRAAAACEGGGQGGGVEEKEERRFGAFWFVWILKLAIGE